MNKLDQEFGSGFKIRQYRNYFRVADKHIFIGCDKNTLFILNKIKSHHNSKIHVFIGANDDLNDDTYNTFADIMAHSNQSIKLYIHFPYELKDLYMKFLKKCNLEANKRLMILCERKFPYFKSPTHKLVVKYENGYINTFVDLYHMECMIKNNDAVIQDKVQLEDPEAHKDEIIGRFKSTTPLSILKSFKDEDDIWDFIKLENEWAVPNKNIHKRVDINTTEKDIDKVKENVTEIIKNTVASIMEEGNKEGE